MVDFMISSGRFLYPDSNPAATAAPVGDGPLNGADRRKTSLRNRHAIGDMARGANVEVESEHRVRAALLGPPDQPSERGLADLGAQKSGFGANDRVSNFGDGQNIANKILGALGDRQHAAPQPIDKIDLLHGIDAQVAGEPELIDAAADVAVAVVEQIDIFLHPLLADPPRDLLIDRHGGS